MEDLAIAIHARLLRLVDIFMLYAFAKWLEEQVALLCDIISPEEPGMWHFLRV